MRENFENLENMSKSVQGQDDEHPIGARPLTLCAQEKYVVMANPHFDFDVID